MKKSLSLLVAIAMVFSMFATLVSADGKAAGEKLESYGIIKGTSEGLAEDQEWVRKDVTVLIARLLGKVEEASTHANTHGFEDLDSKFYNGYVSWAKENGFFVGQSATKFAPNASITNQEFAVVLLRVLNALEGKTEEVDYSTAFEAAVELGLVAEGLDKKDNAIRGNIYEALVKSLDYKVGGKTIGNILGLPGFEITELDIVKASAVVSNSISLEFNTELESLKNADVSVKNEDGVTVLIEKVTFEGTKATIALSDKLSNGKTYSVTVAAAKSKEGFEATNLTTNVTYNKAVPAKIAFASKTVVLDNKLDVVISDANGNNVTADFIDNVVTESSNWAVIDNDTREAKSVGDAIVNVYLVVDEDEDVRIETGNEIISVVALTQLTITDVSFSNKVAENNLTLYVEKDEFGNRVSVPVLVKAKDQKSTEVNNSTTSKGQFDKLSIRSLNPAIVQVDTDNDGAVQATALQVGSATVEVTVEKGGVKATKSVVVTVKAEKVFSGIELSTSSLKLVKPSTVIAAGYTPIDYTVTVKTVDQYGNKIKLDPTKVEIVKSVRSDKFSIDNATYSDGEVKYTVTADDNGSTTIQFKVTYEGKTYTKTMNVSQADLNGLGGYEVDYKDVLDKNAVDNIGGYAADGAKLTTDLVVYAKDRNGVRFANINEDFAAQPANFPLNTLEFGTLNGKIATVDAFGKVTTGSDLGKTTLTVTIDNNIVARPAIEVINTAPTLTKVQQVKETIKVSTGSIVTELFGSGKALEVLDQYGNQLTAADVDGKYTIATSNSSVVTSEGVAVGSGKAVITVAINNAFYVVNVTVE